MLLFVYGTLRREAANHHELRDATFIGRARTQPKYELVDMGGFPALLEGGADAVVGEVYEIHGALLTALDAFEEVPELYERKDIAIDRASSTTPEVRLLPPRIEAYVMSRERANSAPRLPNGDWISCSQ
jgi:gamma-glutamylaminecyclotransferase